jgi:disulfide bond formation protein DsbB
MSIEPPAPPGAAPATSAAVASPAYTWAALAVAVLTVLGAFYLSFVEGKFPCPLCFYQRAFALGVVGVLAAGLVSGVNARISVATLALPVASAGLGVALWHVHLVRTDVLVCPAGMFGISTAPAQSMAAFGLLSAVLVLDAYQAGRQGNGFLPVVASVVLGFVLAAPCCLKLFNEQPKRPIPAQEYEDESPKICLPKKPA